MLVTLATPRRVLPIWIGQAEGNAIAAALRKVQMPRPMTHDLLLNALTELGWRVEKLVVSDLRDSTFYGELHLTAGGRHKVLDCRPSDGLALALRAKAPILVAPHVFAACGPPPIAPAPSGR
jgi:bifunctional DNase/RNase